MREGRGAQLWQRLLGATFLLAATPLAAQSAPGGYPLQPVRMIVPFAAGGVADVMARLLGSKFADAWGPNVFVENRPGAGGAIGMDAVQKSPADGYTIALVASTLIISANLNAAQPFNLMKDFEPIGFVGASPILFAANPQKVTANSLREFHSLARSQAGKFRYGECGVASPHHYAAELFKFKSRVDLLHVPYKGCPQSIVDVVSGVIDTAFLSTTIAIPHLRSGKLKPLGVTGRSRTAAAPDVPTFIESGIPELSDFVVELWVGLMAPAGTPKEILAKIGSEARKALDLPDVRQRMLASGVDPRASAPEEMAAAMRAEMASVAQVIRLANMKTE